ncbi:hypothetical protein FGO68_gene16234 [Halteria grandinella]|uniref:Uncharacterized protein n=1 Tax=Halteria grandinella TaxID=5974 RepID=A0A8J8NRP8_HALGN|nr:hypothetical protein FGO68_gene16234 [Halteria grandinella]
MKKTRVVVNYYDEEMDSKEETKDEQFELRKQKFTEKLQQTSHLEKQFIRLGIQDTHSQDIDSTIRSCEQLEEAFNHCIEKYRCGLADYQFLSDQLRGIRQEMTVRKMEDAFQIKVYDEHFKQSIHHADMDQFVQSSTRLKELLAEKPEYEVRLSEVVAIHYVFYSLQDRIDMLNQLTSEYPQIYIGYTRVKFANLLRNIRLRNYLGILRQSDVSEEIKGIIQIFQQKILQNAIRNYTVTYQLGIACEEFQKLLNINTSESFQEIATQYKVNITKEGRVDCKATYQQFKK